MTDADFEKRRATALPEKADPVKYSYAGGISSGDRIPTMGERFSAFLKDHRDRKNADKIPNPLVTDDHHFLPPSWIEKKNIAIDGTPMELKDRPANYWEHKYKRELEIGDSLVHLRQREIHDMEHDLLKVFRQAATLLGLKNAVPENKQEAVEEALQRMDSTADKEERMASAKILAEERQSGWQKIMGAVESQRPLAKLAKDSKPRIDFYGIDQILDSPVNMVWLLMKLGMLGGIVHGSVKGFQVVAVDHQFLKASGVGAFSILNVTMMASGFKWAGNMFAFSTAFVIGDRLASYAKHLVYPRHEASYRSPINYACGCAFTFGTVGIIPWWLLSDLRSAARVGATGLALGFVVGYAMGRAMDYTISMNLQRLDASPRELRRFEALFRREREWVQTETERRRALLQIDAARQ